MSLDETIWSGPGVSTGRPEGFSEMIDIAPTVLALLGLPVAEDLTGRVLRELVAPVFWERHPVTTIPIYRDVVNKDAVPDAELPPDAELYRQLEALGYIGGESHGDTPATDETDE